MNKIYFYKTKSGKIPILEYLQLLAERKDKDSRIKLNKIRDYIKVLQNRGVAAGMPYIRHIEGEIYELRPIRDRILFFTMQDGKYILLHHFMKQTQKTPKKEIEKAYREIEEIKRGELSYEK